MGSPQGIDLTIRESGSERRILAQPGTDAVANVCGPGAATLLVGPEGGWTAEEASLAQDHGFLATSLGEGILRSETAAVALTAVIASREYARSEQ